MSEQPDFETYASDFFGQPNPEFEAAAREYLDAVRAFTRRSFGQASFFAPILCSCARWYNREDSDVLGDCFVHGAAILDRKTDAVLLFAFPKKW
jgi:hypothetical protein